KVLFEDQAQYQQDQRAPDPKVHPTELKASASSAFIAAVLNVLAFSARCPPHECLLPRAVLPPVREMLTLPVSDLGECHRREVSGGLLPVLRQVATAIRYAPAYRCGSPSDRTADLPPTDKHCDLSRLPAFAASAVPVLRQASLARAKWMQPS